VDERSDTELLLASRAEPVAFVELYRRHAEDVLRYFARRTLDPEAAAELTAETFAEAYASRQINYINNQVAESTIKVDLHEPGAAAAQSPDTVDNPSLGHAWDRAVQGLLNVIAATLIGLGYLIPLLIIAGIVFVIVRLARRRRMPVENV